MYGKEQVISVNIGGLKNWTTRLVKTMVDSMPDFSVMPRLGWVKRKYPALALAAALIVITPNAMAGENTNNLTTPAVPRVTPRLEQPAPAKLESQIAHRELMRRLREAIEQLRDEDPDAQGCMEG
jgi:cellulase/cellobiase CelA1